MTKSVGATEDLFEHKFRHTDSCEGWRVGAKLECADPDKPDLVHVATVTNMMESRVLIHFDGWSHSYDFYCPPSSPLLHPVGWCAAHGGRVAPPLDSDPSSSWSWPCYLSSTASSTAIAAAIRLSQQAHLEAQSSASPATLSPAHNVNSQERYHSVAVTTESGASALREWKTLQELRRVATAITIEPVECMWSWGRGWENQWHGAASGAGVLRVVISAANFLDGRRGELAQDVDSSRRSPRMPWNETHRSTWPGRPSSASGDPRTTRL